MFIHIQSSTSIIHTNLGMFFTSPPAVLQTVLPWLLDLAQWGRFRFWNLQFQPKLHEKGVQKGNYSNSTTQLIFLENHHFKKKKARTNQKFRPPGRNLSDFCWGNSNGLKVEATKIGRATWARCTARIDTSVDDMDGMESHNDAATKIVQIIQGPKHVEGCPEWQ